MKTTNIIGSFLLVGFLGASFGNSIVFSAENTGLDGLTFSQRKQQWLASVPDPLPSMDNEERLRYLFSWLEKGIYDDVVSETIQYLVRDYWYDGIRAQAGYAMMILLKYGSVGNGLISSADEQIIKDRYIKSITESDFFSHVNPNKQLYAMVGAFLFTEFFDKSLEFPKFGYPITLSENNIPSYFHDTWPDFSFNGHVYQYGSGPYNANQLAKDWLLWAMQTWYVNSEGNGPREFDSIDYARAFPGATALLWSLSPDTEPELKHRAKMATDLMLVDTILDFSANSLGGTIGRSDFRFTRRSPIFPTHVYWGMGEDIDRFDVRGLYQVGYEPPDVIVNIGVLGDEGDSYWHFNKEHNGNWLLNNPDFGKWTWVTKYYNLGSNVGAAKQGWQANVGGNGNREFIRVWINEEASNPPEDQESTYLGTNGRQFRNTLFADIGSTPYLHQQKVRTDWELEETVNGWLFKKLGRSMVAIKIIESVAAIEIDIEGVDYASWSEFKSAVLTKAKLTTDFFINSQKISIGKTDYCGLNSPGDCVFPFKRIETIDNQGNHIVSWNNNVMRISRGGKTLVYDFNNWTYREESQTGDSSPPIAPINVNVEAN